jgi:hypothetical protein
MRSPSASLAAGLLALVLTPVGGAGAQPALTPFHQDAQKAIYAELPYERDRFALAPSGEAMPVVLYSWSSGTLGFESVTCALNAGFRIRSDVSEAGIIAVNVCPEHVERLRTLAIGSAKSFDEVLAALQAKWRSAPMDALRTAGMYRERSTVPGGADLHYVGLIAPGFGITILPTVVLLTDAQAVVVQAEAMKLCGEGRPPLPLCADPKRALAAIAQRLLR